MLSQRAAAPNVFWCILGMQLHPLKTFIHRKYTVGIDRIQICTKDKKTIIRNVLLYITYVFDCLMTNNFLCLLFIRRVSAIYLYSLSRPKERFI